MVYNLCDQFIRFLISGLIYRFSHNHSVEHFSELVGCLCYESTLNEPDGTQRILTVSRLTLWTQEFNLVSGYLDYCQ